MNRLVRLFLERRGLDEAGVASLMDTRHSKLKDMDAAVGLLRAAFEADAQIVVLPDFDMDGIAAGVLGYAGLSEMGFDARLYVPDASRGYGFDAETIDDVVVRFPDCKMVLTCDVGIGCVDGVARAKALGLRVLVTDHHAEDEGASARGVADVCVDPCRIDEDYAHPQICGAFVLWQVLDAYACTYCSVEVRDAVERLRVFAGIGTVSDTMPMLHENRELVAHAVSILRMVWSCGDGWFLDAMGGSNAYRQAFFGLKAVCDGLSEAGKVSDVHQIDEGFLGFYVAPLFNACKRMGCDMELAFGVFTEPDAERRVARLLEVNEARKQRVSEDYSAMLDGADGVLYPFGHVIHTLPGVRGLLASASLADTGQPCFVVSINDDGSYDGSGRAPDWYPMRSRLSSAFPDKSVAVAGHEQAFGCTFSDYGALLSAVEFVRDDVAAFAESARAEMEAGEVLGYDICIASDGSGDCGIDLALLAEFADAVCALSPFGRGWREPDVMLRFDGSEAVWRRMGSEDQHLKATLPYGLDLVFWNEGHRLDAGDPFGVLEAHGKLQVNEWRNRHSLQFVASSLSKAV